MPKLSRSCLFSAIAATVVPATVLPVVRLQTALAYDGPLCRPEEGSAFGPVLCLDNTRRRTLEAIPVIHLVNNALAISPAHGFVGC